MKDENELYDVGDAVGSAARPPQQASAFQGGRGLLADAADLGVGGVVPSLPPLEPTAWGFFVLPDRTKGSRSTGGQKLNRRLDAPTASDCP
ncbi:hypothetical protein ACFUN7_25120 [Streptomyces sp. NPDC057236]|uniref:hypothetical protein n=1 Tax=Streptomyces sp. NPDC057236 TaxID=3346059 RepID=UPI003643FC83